MPMTAASHRFPAHASMLRGFVATALMLLPVGLGAQEGDGSYARSYIALGGGLGLTASHNKADTAANAQGQYAVTDYTAFGLSGVLDAKYGPAAIWVQGIPLGGIRTVHAGASLEVYRGIGIAGEWGMLDDREVDRVVSRYLAFGLRFRPTDELDMKILVGGTTSGTMELWPAGDSLGRREEVDGFWSAFPPGAYTFEFRYRGLSGYSALFKLTSTILTDYELHHEDLLGNMYATRVFMFAVQKEFSLD